MSVLPPGFRQSLRRVATTATVVTTVGLGLAATTYAAVGTSPTAPVAGHAALTPHARAVDPNSTLSNSVTSTSDGANCVTGTEAGCSVVLGVPIIAPQAAAGLATFGLGIAGVAVFRRRAATNP